MSRLYLPLVPVAVLAAVVALNAACSRGGRGEEGDNLRVVPPPAAAYAAAPAPLLASTGDALRTAPEPAADPAPTADEEKAFDAPVRK